MANSVVEHDFFRMKKENSNTSLSHPIKLLNHRRSFRDIQGVISKMNPDLLKSVIGSGSFSDPTPNAINSYIDKSESTSNTAPLTILYNGTVAVFNMPRDKADIIFKIAAGSFSKEADPNNAASSSNQCEFPSPKDEDLPIARRKSLQRFLAKRQERATLSIPYFRPEKVPYYRFNQQS